METSARDALSAGDNPASSAATSDNAVANATTSQSTVSEISTGIGKAGSSPTSRGVMSLASRRPANRPSTKSISVSVRSCRTRRDRPAPIARRSAISRRRPEARARSRPATFAQAMTRIVVAIADSSNSAATASGRLPAIGDAGSSRYDRAASCPGYSSRNARSIVSSSAAACAIVAPRARRAPITTQPDRRASSWPAVAVMPSGSHRSGATMVVP